MGAQWRYNRGYGQLSAPIIDVSRETERTGNNAMPFVPFENCAQVEMVYRWDGQIVENVLNYRTNTTPTAANMDALCSFLVTTWNTYLKPLQSAAVQLQLLRATSLHVSNGPAIEYTAGLPASGTGTTAAVPNNVAVVIKWVTGLRGRSYRGRTYHLGIPQASVTGSSLVTGYRNSLGTAWSNFVIIPTTPQWNLVVCSRYSNGLIRPTGVSTPVTGYSINPTCDSQRRRLPERGL